MPRSSLQEDSIAETIVDDRKPAQAEYETTEVSPPKITLTSHKKERELVIDDDEDDVRMPRFKIKRDDSTKLRNAQS